MIATVPAKRVRTIYSRIGDVLPLAAGVMLGIGLLAALRRRRAWSARSPAATRRMNRGDEGLPVPVLVLAPEIEVSRYWFSPIWVRFAKFVRTRAR